MRSSYVDYLKKVNTIKTDYVANTIEIKDGVDALQKAKDYKKEYYKNNKEKIKKYVNENKNKKNALYHINKFKKTGIEPKKQFIIKWKLYKENNEWKSEYIV